MKVASIIIGSMVLAAVCFVAGALTGGMEGWFSPVVDVVVENDSGEDLTKLVLTHKSRGQLTAITLQGLKNRQSAKIRYLAGDPSGYRIEAVMRDGRVLKGGAGYAEPGYSTREIITRSGIGGSGGFLGAFPWTRADSGLVNQGS